MSDLIDRQALRAAHELGSDCHDCKRDMKSCQYDRDYSLMDFCEWLDDAPTASPWHRVEEPPKVSCKVIAYAVSNSTGERDVTTAYYKQRSSRFHITGRRSHWRVTHWMPIEPPKEE